MLRSLEFLSEKDFTSKDIPFMHTKTIEYLLKQKMCICGTHLDEGSVPYNKVKELTQFLPPQSISTTISDFKKEAKRRANAHQDVYDQIKANLAVISQLDEELTDLQDELHIIEGKLSGDDVRSKVKAINSEIQLCDRIIRESSAEKEKLLVKKGGYESEAERADTERRNLTLLDEKNKKIEIYKAYAERIYRELLEVYETSEAEIRMKLETTINDIFKQIYEGGLYLTIDEKYHISVYANDYDGDVETSTAQSISVIFAFITGIIKLARDNRNATDENAKLLSSEPYPLVMDAPLSAFDKRRIKTVCEALPNIAEQVIIFIKDTDGELAEEYMGDKIGCRHYFDKKNEFETVLV
jgi:DNA sulfur modification protein DndD